MPKKMPVLGLLDPHLLEQASQTYHEVRCIFTHCAASMSSVHHLPLPPTECKEMQPIFGGENLLLSVYFCLDEKHTDNIAS